MSSCEITGTPKRQTENSALFAAFVAESTASVGKRRRPQPAYFGHFGSSLLWN
jgi:hypothetical protein